MSKSELLRGLQRLFMPSPRRAQQETAHDEGFVIAADRVLTSGVSRTRWGTALQVVIQPSDLPTVPVALAVRLTLRKGYAGCGWYDEDGLAEEVHVGPGPCTRAVFLTLSKPALCRSLIVRSVRPEPLDVTLERLNWVPLREALASPNWCSNLSALPNDSFLDMPFDGYLTEALWRNHQNQNWHDPDFRLRRLKLLVSLGWKHCPGYREWWSRHGWHPSDLRSLEDADTIPVITKEQIRTNLEAFSLPRRNALMTSTSGSTGQPFSFRYTSALRAGHFSHVAVAHSYAMPDQPLTQTRFAVLSASALRGLSATGAGGSLILSPTALRQPEDLLDLLRAYQPTVLYGMPSSAAKLAEAIVDKYRFRTAILSSENMLPFQIASAEKISDKVIANYGLSEGAAFALRCRSCGTYGELPGHGLITLRSRPDGLFEIIGTGFWSLGTLFINYATGDLSAGRAAHCPACPASTSHFSNIIGREQDALLDETGSQYTIALLYRVLIPHMHRIKLYDFLQIEPGRALLRYTSHDDLPLDHETIERGLRRVIPTLNISLQLTPQLVATRDDLSARKKWKLVKTSVETRV